MMKRVARLLCHRNVEYFAGGSQVYIGMVALLNDGVSR